MILAVGNPVFDLIETPRGKSQQRIVSGCSTNAALVCAKLGTEIALVGAVGDDFRGTLQELMNRYSISGELLPSRRSGGFSLKYIDDAGNRELKLIERANDIAEVPDYLLTEAEAVLIGPILGEISPQLIADMRQACSGLLFCDPQGLLRRIDADGNVEHFRRENIEAILSVFDIVKPNELEAAILTGIDCRRDPYAAAKKIYSWGPGMVIITLAELGSVIYDGKEFYDIPPYAVDVVDATGAGDTYMGAFAVARLDGLRPADAGRFASSAASIMVENIGPEAAISRSLVETRMKTLEAVEYRLPLEAP